MVMIQLIRVVFMVLFAGSQATFSSLRRSNLKLMTQAKDVALDLKIKQQKWPAMPTIGTGEKKISEACQPRAGTVNVETDPDLSTFVWGNMKATAANNRAGALAICEARRNFVELALQYCNTKISKGKKSYINCLGMGTAEVTSDLDVTCVGRTAGLITKCYNEQFEKAQQIASGIKFDTNIYCASWAFFESYVTAENIPQVGIYFSEATPWATFKNIDPATIDLQHKVGMAKLAAYYAIYQQHTNGEEVIKLDETTMEYAGHSINLMYQSAVFGLDMAPEHLQSAIQVRRSSSDHFIQNIVARRQANGKTPEGLPPSFAWLSSVIGQLPGVDNPIALTSEVEIKRNALYAQKCSAMWDLIYAAKAPANAAAARTHLADEISKAMVFGVETYWTAGAFLVEVPKVPTHVHNYIDSVLDNLGFVIDHFESVPDGATFQAAILEICKYAWRVFASLERITDITVNLLRQVQRKVILNNKDGSETAGIGGIGRRQSCHDKNHHQYTKETCPEWTLDGKFACVWHEDDVDLKGDNRCIKISPDHDGNDERIGTYHEIAAMLAYPPSPNFQKIFLSDNKVSSEVGLWKALYQIYKKGRRGLIYHDLLSKCLLSTPESENAQLVDQSVYLQMYKLGVQSEAITLRCDKDPAVAKKLVDEGWRALDDADFLKCQLLTAKNVKDIMIYFTFSTMRWFWLANDYILGIKQQRKGALEPRPIGWSLTHEEVLAHLKAPIGPEKVNGEDMTAKPACHCFEERNRGPNDPPMPAKECRGYLMRRASLKGRQSAELTALPTAAPAA